MSRIFRNVRIVSPGDNEESLFVRMGVSSFGITEAIAGAISTFLVGDLGVGAATASTIGSIGAGALEGGAIGALTNPKNPLKGAEYGAITAGVGTGIAPLVGDLGLGVTATDAISGAVGGLAGAAATGRNPVTGALEGGLGGLVTGAMAPGTATPAGGTAATGGPLTSAVSTAAPASVTAAPSGADFATLTGATPSSVGTPTLAGGTPAVPAIAADAATAPTNTGSFADFLKSPRGLLSVGGLALDAIKGNQALPGQKQITADAAMLAQQGSLLQSYERSGTLPPGLEMGLKQASEAAKASIRSAYAASGESGSSAEMQDLAAVDERASVQGAQLAIQLLQQGVSETGMADKLYMELMGNALQQDQALGTAIASFASGMVPAAPGTTSGSTGTA